MMLFLFQYMVITYLLQVFWLLLFICLVVITFVLTLCVKICNSERIEKHECIDFQQFGKQSLNSSFYFEKDLSQLSIFFRFPVPQRSKNRVHENMPNE